VWALPRIALKTLLQQETLSVESPGSSVGVCLLTSQKLRALGLDSLIPQGLKGGGDPTILKATIPLSFIQDSDRRNPGAYAFLDHSGLTRIHIMKKSSPVTADDFRVDSEVRDLPFAVYEPHIVLFHSRYGPTCGPRDR
jgi:hypothetical protein